ncbi:MULTISPECIES: hypothetical protein [Spiribacter]|uniref:DUF1656 domain-containing protein n=2 Tax=Spiribacter TaxID=1335745 RepID=A0ABV3S732_9GAMM
MIPLFGTLFPGWILVVFAAAVVTIGLTAALRLVGISRAIPLKPVFNLALFLLVTFILWEFLYGSH